MRKSLTRAEILRSKSEIAQLFAGSGSGVVFSGSVQNAGLKLIFVAREENGGSGRDLFFVSPVKRLGSAVQRNRAKRRQRELLRHSKERLRQISQRAAQLASVRRLVYPQLVYHWGLVIYTAAAEGRWDLRYWDLLPNLEKLLGQKWRQFSSGAE